MHRCGNIIRVRYNNQGAWLFLPINCREHSERNKTEHEGKNMMGIRIVTGVISGFIALTAVGGGLAMLLGSEANRFPVEWLEGTPFKDYTIPALLLTVVVGGFSLVTCVMILIRHKAAGFFSMAAGLVMMGYIVVEILILKQAPPGPTVTEMVYFGLGLILTVLGVIRRIPQ
jgi:hypothetical protein